MLYFSYLRIVIVQHSNLKQSTTRVAMVLPIYAILLYFSQAIPAGYQALQIPIAFVEGYSFYCFFALVVMNMSGPLGCIRVMEELNRKPICGCCCPEEPRKLYARVLWALFLFMVVRPLFVVAAVVCAYANSVPGQIIFLLISFGFVANGFVSLITFCKSVCIP